MSITDLVFLSSLTTAALRQSQSPPLLLQHQSFVTHGLASLGSLRACPWLAFRHDGDLNGGSQGHSLVEGWVAT